MTQISKHCFIFLVNIEIRVIQWTQQETFICENESLIIESFTYTVEVSFDVAIIEQQQLR